MVDPKVTAEALSEGILYNECSGQGPVGTKASTIKSVSLRNQRFGADALS